MNATITTLGISWEMEQPTAVRCGGDLFPNTTAILWCRKKNLLLQAVRTVEHCHIFQFSRGK